LPTRHLRQQLLQLIRNHSHLVRNVRPLEIAVDPGDDEFLERADAARADYLCDRECKALFKILEED
jgi:hypothetical protein